MYQNQIILNGKKNSHNKNAIETYSNVPVVGELEYMETVSKKALLSQKPNNRLNEIFSFKG